jgi:hypothetical protein
VSRTYFDPAVIKHHAEQFSVERFVDTIRGYVEHTSAVPMAA